MTQSNKILSDITVFNKYAKYQEDLNRRESWEEICSRYCNMLIKKYPKLEFTIRNNMEYIVNKKVLPSMRGMQFAGLAIERNESRIYNCAYLPVNDYRSFSETMFLLLGGTGVGYSVQYKHIDELPVINKPIKLSKFVIDDSLIGWADAVKALMKSYLSSTIFKPKFDFSDIRAKGTRLKTAGGKAPGAEPLKICLAHIEAVLESKNNGDKLTPIECHDIMCYIADAVLSGGIRRSAMISLFSFDDEEMLTCKYGNWWEKNPQRGRANNSAVIVRNRIKKEEFNEIWNKIELSNSGEPGLYFTNNSDWGTNPCCFTGDIKLLTPNGYRTFKDLASEVYFEAYNKDGEIVPAKVWSNGFKETIVMRLSNGTHITCTPDHRFMDISEKEIEAKDTKGTRLMPYYTINKQVSDCVKYGFIQGDANTCRLKSLTHKGLEIYFGEKDQDVAELFNLPIGTQYITEYNDILKELDFSSEELPKRGLPGKFNHFNASQKLQFLKGLYSANGSVISAGRVSLKTTCKLLADQIVSSIHGLSNYKIKPYITTNKEKEITFSNGNYICKESYDINIATFEGIKWFSENIGFIQNYKQDSLIKLILSKAPMVLSIGNTREKEVFDFSLDDNTHWGVVEGVIAHNCEVALRPYQFCNLCEINASDVDTQEELNKRAEIASFFGTLQAGFTDFHYLRPIWRKTTEKDALIGVGMTGIASGKVLKLNLKEAVEKVKQANELTAYSIGINKAARTTVIKPSGTTSCVLGTSSGIHAWHNDYYIRRMRLLKSDPLFTYLIKEIPNLLEDAKLEYNTSILSIPQKAPEGSILRTESALNLLERVKKFNLEWVREGHVKGDNTNNVSATISINKNNTYPSNLEEKEGFYTYNLIDEWKAVGEWMWNNKDTFNGLSVMPYDNGSYVQAPFEDCTEEVYKILEAYLKEIDLTKVIEIDDNTEHTQEIACSGGQCSI